MLAARSNRRYLARSGMYYLPFAWSTQFGAHWEGPRATAVCESTASTANDRTRS
jgi:hypothetical protein